MGQCQRIKQLGHLNMNGKYQLKWDQLEVVGSKVHLESTRNFYTVYQEVLIIPVSFDFDFLFFKRFLGVYLGSSMYKLVFMQPICYTESEFPCIAVFFLTFGEAYFGEIKFGET